MRTFITYMEYDSPAEFKSALRTFWMPFLNKVPEKLHEEFLTDTVAQYLKDNPADKKGRVRIKMKRLEFCGEKPLKQ
jgi:trans-aconitate methyltransferase